MSFWYFYFEVWSFLIITARDTPSKKVILILLLGNLECPYNYKMKLLLIKKMILIFLIRNLKYPYNHHLKYLSEQKWFWYFYLEMQSALISNARDILIKSHLGTFIWKFQVPLRSPHEMFSLNMSLCYYLLEISSVPIIIAWDNTLTKFVLILLLGSDKCPYSPVPKYDGDWSPFWTNFITHFTG